MNIYFAGIIVSMIIYIVLGIVISKRVKNANDFFVAGRQAPTVLVAGSLIASYCSTGLFMGDAGEAYSGFFTPLMLVVMMQSGGYILGSVFFGKYLRRSEALTIPEFFGKRFHSRPLQVLAGLTAVVIMTIYLLSVMQGVGTLMNYVTGIDYRICIVLILITLVILTVTSGAKGVLITDTIMFGIFTAASLVAVGIILGKIGGWNAAVKNVTDLNDALFSWHGDLTHLYPTGAENVAWGVMSGLTWVSVCAIGPWQSSRYLMAKNEHVAVRASVFAAVGVTVLEFLVPATAVLLNVFSDKIPDATQCMIWAATNMVPIAVGVVMLTGVVAAGISSATTFLSLVGSSVANDIMKNKNDSEKLKFGRWSIVIVCIIVMILAVFNPPQIYIIMLLSGTVVVCSWFPVCIVSVWSKRVTKAGAFAGMLGGFIGCASTKIIGAVGGVSIPIYLDSFVVGLVINIVCLIVVSKITSVSKEEMESRAKLFVVPEGQDNPVEVRKTKRALLGFVLFGISVFLVLLFLWVLPYYSAL